MKALILIIALSTAACGINTTHGTGTKIGQVVKLSKAGFLVDTWEAQLIRGGLIDGSGAVGGVPFDFTVSETLAPVVQRYLEDQTEVVITYETEGVYAATRSDSGGDFLLTIEPAKSR